MKNNIKHFFSLKRLLPLALIFSMLTQLLVGIAPVSAGLFPKNTVTFDSNGGSSVASQSVDFGGKIVKPTDPTMVGYSFDGWHYDVCTSIWDLNPVCIYLRNHYGFRTVYDWDFAHYPVLANLTLEAQWTPLAQYMVSALASPIGGGAVSGSGTYYEGDDFNLVATSNIGYSFSNWSGDCSGVNATYHVDNLVVNMFCMANFEINQYTITFDTAGGSAVVPIIQDYGTAITAPSDPTWENGSHKFTGWDVIVPATMPAYNQTITANWEERYVLTFNDNGADDGQAPMIPDYYDQNEVVVVPDNNPTDSYVKTGYHFAGWNTKADGSGDSYAPGSNITMVEYTILYAQWKKNQYTIDFVENGGSAVADITADFGEPITVPANPIRTGYTFVGWDTPIPATMPAEDMTITAQWKINSYTMIFNSNGGTPVSSKTQDYDTAITAPTAPTRTGYTFAGWDIPIPATMPAFSQTISAKWTVNNYSIYFDEAGGSTVTDITQAYGTAVTVPASPTRIGYAFAGWLPLVPSTMPAYNSTLTAQWANLLVTVTYVAGNGGTVNGASTQIINYGEDTTEVIATPSTGYVFDSWSDGITTAARSDLGVTVSKTVTANFKASGEVKGAATNDNEAELAGASNTTNCDCWCNCNLLLGISWCWWILIIAVILAIAIWRVVVFIERRRENL